MAKELNIYFSNHLDLLYQRFKNTLYPPFSNPFARRLLIVYGPAMKSWLMLKMAQDPDLGIATGIEFVYLNQAFETLLDIFQVESSRSIPSSLTLELAIEKEIMNQLGRFNSLNETGKKNWLPLINYLNLDPMAVSRLKLSVKMEKRLIGLSQQTAKYFRDYGRFAGPLTDRWNENEPSGWQEDLWRSPL